MPTYEYECQKCGYRFEKFQSITEEPLKRCPICRCQVKRLLGTGSGIIFKGNGFHQTDYRNQSYKESEKQEKSMADLKDGKKKETKEASVSSKNTKDKTTSDGKE